MIVSDDVAYPRQYLYTDSIGTEDEKYAGYLVLSPGMPPLVVWWTAVLQPYAEHMTEKKLKQWCDGTSTGLVRTYPYPEVIASKYLQTTDSP